jgi:hypothetical protein
MASFHLCAGVFAIIVMASLPLLICRHLRRRQASLIALVSRHQASIIALVVMASLPLMRRHLCRCLNGNCCSCHNGIVAVVDVQASPLLSS